MPPQAAEVDDDVPACARLAAAVIRQAFHDLQYGSVARRTADLTRIRDDARDFLMRRLWESDCLWYELVGHLLVHRRVVLEVTRREQVDA
jgi:hypothetical protein